MYSTEELVRLCREKNPRAQQALYEKYKSKLMGICIRYTKIREEAEDVFQEAFIKIFNKIEQVEHPEYLERWLKQTTVHTAINYYHKNKRHQGHLDTDYVYAANTDYERIVSRLSNEELIEVVNSLPEGYRMVFNLYVIEDYNHKEIGKILNISENTSKSQLSRAKAMLKKRLKSLGIERFEKYV